MNAWFSLRRVLSAVAFMVIGAGAGILLPDDGPSPGGSTPGVVDVGFSQDMVVHHQQAVTMAQAVIGRVSPSVSRLATSMELNQIKEMGEMQGWLALWNAPQVPSGPPMTWMSDHHMHHATMPGMASLKELDRLGGLEGRKADIWFLQLMIRHHEGGLIMTDAAARGTTNTQVHGLAVLMASDQRMELAVMTGLLDALGQRPLPSPAVP
jgi:uncharacterized protein (DUF305 family)